MRLMVKGQDGVRQYGREERTGSRGQGLLERSDLLLEGILQECPIPQFVIDSAHRVIAWNRALEKYTGIGADTIVGTRDQWRAFYERPRPVLADLLVDGTIGEISRWYPGSYSQSRLIEGAYEATGYFPHIGKGGTWLYFTAAPIRDREGTIIGALETLEDVTERKRAEEALQRSERLLAEGEQIASWGSWDWDVVTDRLYCSGGLERILGLAHGCPFTLEEVERKVIYPEDVPLFRKNMARAIDDDEPVDCEFRIVRQDGSGEVRVIHVQGAIRRNPEGRPEHMIGTGQDVTERKRAQEALNEAKARAEFYLDLMAHDINNYDQVGIAYLEMALDRLHLGDEDLKLVRKPLEMMLESSRLIANVEKLQQLKTGSVRLEPTDVGQTLAEVIARYRAIPGREVQINFKPAPGLVVMATPLLRDVFANLIGNSIRHTEGPLAINILAGRTRWKGRDAVEVAIEDNGPGIPDSFKNKLFVRLQRGDTRARGKGLGLYLVKVLVDSFGGEVRAEDRVPGDSSKGAKFVVLLPASG